MFIFTNYKPPEHLLTAPTGKHAHPAGHCADDSHILLSHTGGSVVVDVVVLVVVVLVVVVLVVPTGIVVVVVVVLPTHTAKLRDNKYTLPASFPALPLGPVGINAYDAEATVPAINDEVTAKLDVTDALLNADEFSG